MAYLEGMKKALRIALFSFLGLCASTGWTQTTAPDFTVVDIQGNSHSLYADILDQGKIAIVQIAATWCPPCWNLHEAGVLQQMHEAFGPDGTDQVRVLWYEADPNTDYADIHGFGVNTIGDWVEGTTYPIVNESPLQLDMGIWRPWGYPTINVVRPSDRAIVLNVGLISSFQGQVEAINEASLDGIVLGQSVVSGCTYALASNFNPEANAEDGSCFFMGCTDPMALNHQLFATVENGTCEYPAPEESCPSDIDGDGATATPDLLLFLASFGQPCAE